MRVAHKHGVTLRQLRFSLNFKSNIARLLRPHCATVTEREQACWCGGLIPARIVGALQADAHDEAGLDEVEPGLAAFVEAKLDRARREFLQ